MTPAQWQIVIDVALVGMFAVWLYKQLFRDRSGNSGRHTHWKTNPNLGPPILEETRKRNRAVSSRERFARLGISPQAWAEECGYRLGIKLDTWQRDCLRSIFADAFAAVAMQQEQERVDAMINSLGDKPISPLVPGKD